MSVDKALLCCPLCQMPNSCAEGRAEACWCLSTEIPAELIKLVPAKQKGRVCICPDCVQAYRSDPELFTKTLKEA